MKLRITSQQILISHFLQVTFNVPDRAEPPSNTSPKSVADWNASTGRTGEQPIKRSRGIPLALNNQSFQTSRVSAL